MNSVLCCFRATFPSKSMALYWLWQSNMGISGQFPNSSMIFQFNWSFSNLTDNYGWVLRLNPLVSTLTSARQQVHCERPTKKWISQARFGRCSENHGLRMARMPKKTWLLSNSVWNTKEKWVNYLYKIIFYQPKWANHWFQQPKWGWLTNLGELLTDRDITNKTCWTAGSGHLSDQDASTGPCTLEVQAVKRKGRLSEFRSKEEKRTWPLTILQDGEPVKFHCTF